LELEITESLIMEDVKHGIALLKQIRALGVPSPSTTSDGFSSLSHLAKLPVDTLKIDRSFIMDMTDSAESFSLVSTIVNLAHAMKLKVVAEGVETTEQARLLRSIHCEEFQGFLFSKQCRGKSSRLNSSRRSRSPDYTPAPLKSLNSSPAWPMPRP